MDTHYHCNVRDTWNRYPIWTLERSFLINYDLCNICTDYVRYGKEVQIHHSKLPKTDNCRLDHTQLLICTVQYPMYGICNSHSKHI